MPSMRIVSLRKPITSIYFLPTMAWGTNFFQYASVILEPRLFTTPTDDDLSWCFFCTYSNSYRTVASVFAIVHASLWTAQNWCHPCISHAMCHRMCAHTSAKFLKETDEEWCCKKTCAKWESQFLQLRAALLVGQRGREPQIKEGDKQLCHLSNIRACAKRALL